MAGARPRSAPDARRIEIGAARLALSDLSGMSGRSERLAEFDPFAADGGTASRLHAPGRLLGTPLEGNQLAVFTDGRGMEDAPDAGRWRGELKLSETVFMLLPREPEGTRGSGSSRPPPSCPSRATRCWARPTVLAGALGRDRVVLETGSGPVEVALAPGARPRAQRAG